MSVLVCVNVSKCICQYISIHTRITSSLWKCVCVYIVHRSLSVHHWCVCQCVSGSLSVSISVDQCLINISINISESVSYVHRSLSKYHWRVRKYIRVCIFVCQCLSACQHWVSAYQCLSLCLSVCQCDGVYIWIYVCQCLCLCIYKCLSSLSYLLSLSYLCYTRESGMLGSEAHRGNTQCVVVWVLRRLGGDMLGRVVLS